MLYLSLAQPKMMDGKKIKRVKSDGLLKKCTAVKIMLVITLERLTPCEEWLTLALIQP